MCLYLCAVTKNKTMKTVFEKTKFNPDFDHKTSIINMMNEMGYTNVTVQSSFTNGLSHYVRLTVEVLNEGKCYAYMYTYSNYTDITIRISDHASGLELHCGGVCGNKMTMHAFKKLIAVGAIKASN